MIRSTHKQHAASRARASERRRLPLGASLALGAIGVIAAACGTNAASPTTSGGAAAGGGGTSGGTATQATTGAAGSPTAVDTTKSSSLGTILVNGKGFTLYRLSSDSMNTSTCKGECLKVWPPLLVMGRGSPVAGAGVSGLGTIKVPEGTQVTYHGEPLYTFVGDKSPGQVTGQDLNDTWGTWFVIATKAPKTTTTTAPSGGNTTTTAGGGGGVGF